MDQMIAGRYALGPLVGTGGMAKVYAADDQRLHRRVAIKLVPLAATEPIARQRFIREARAAAGFTHPNAVAVFDAGEADGYLYLVMEMVEGQTLADRLAGEGALAAAESRAIAGGVLQALAAAHAVGIVHRDVKPANILLGRDGSVKLADFGIAKRFDDDPGDVTLAGDVIGTPKYLAPEQIVGDPATPSSDVYALGVVLYEMLAGQPPFDADTPLATALAHRTMAPPDLAGLRPDAPGDLVRIVQTAMAKEPADRFSSATAMLGALTSAAPAPTAVHPSNRRVAPTQVLSPAGYTGRSGARLWVAVVAALAIAGGVIAAIVVTNDDPDDATGVTSVPVTAATAPSTAAATTTTMTPTTPVTTPPAFSGDVTTIDGVIVTLEADPGRYGSATGDLVDRLDKIRGNGNSAERRASELLDQVFAWVDDGELDPAALTLVEPVLTAIAGAGGDEEEDGDD